MRLRRLVNPPHRKKTEFSSKKLRKGVKQRLKAEEDLRSFKESTALTEISISSQSQQLRNLLSPSRLLKHLKHLLLSLSRLLRHLLLSLSRLRRILPQLFRSPRSRQILTKLSLLQYNVNKSRDKVLILLLGDLRIARFDILTIQELQKNRYNNEGYNSSNSPFYFI